MPLVGDNIDYMVEDGNLLHITIDLEKDFGLSSSGKTITVASTRGSVKVADCTVPGVMMGINIYKYPKRSDR